MDSLEEPKLKDPFRDTWIRYLGYANEVGESFRSLVNVNVVRASYVVASGYVVADTLDKSQRISDQCKDKSAAVRRHKVTQVAIDTLLWQAFASVIIPGFTINRICFFAGKGLSRATKLPQPVRKWITTGIGLASIPFIIKPIDHLVDYTMDKTIRTYWPTTAN